LPSSRYLLLFGAGIGFFGCGGIEAASTIRSSQPIVYGADDRIEAYQSGTPGLVDLARGNTVALMPRSYVSEDGNGLRIKAPTWGDDGMLCPGQRFAEQPAAAICTGTLVANDLVLTAGHCLDALPCSGLVVVRGFYYDAPGELHTLTVADVASCREVVAKHVDLPTSGAQLDYAWFRLDRPFATTQTPLLAMGAESIATGSLVLSANHGGGLPLKLQENGRVADARETTLDYFIVNLDAFHGASGAPVFDRDNRVVGLLARGGTDLLRTDEGCFVVFTELEESAHEQATYAFRAVSGLCEHSGASEHSLCPAGSSTLPGDGGGCALTGDGGHAQWPLPVGALLMLAARRIRRAVTVSGKWRWCCSGPRAVPSDRRRR
jgi:hypothetical protein